MECVEGLIEMLKNYQKLVYLIIREDVEQVSPGEVRECRVLSFLD
jgi:hypothetical protein